MTSLILAGSRPDRPRGGTALRNVQHVHALARLGPLDVISIGVDDPAEPIDGVREWVPVSFRQRSRWDRLRTGCWILRPGVYASVDHWYMADVARRLRDRIATHRYDVALVAGISLAYYIPVLKRAGCPLVVFDAHNAESALHHDVFAARPVRGIVRAAKDRVLQRRITATERLAIQRADAVWACSDADARELARAYGTRTPITVMPNAVDVDGYRGEGSAPVSDDWAGTPITLLYTGLFSYSPNEDAAIKLVTEVLPAIRARGHVARAILVGRNPTPAMHALAQRVPGVEITGVVDSVLPYLHQPCVVTLPIMLGSGTRLKILEAFAAGRPVVSSSKGVEGIDAVDGRHLLIREDAASTADAVIDLWTSPRLRQRLCDEALALTRDRYSWPAISARIAASLASQVRPSYVSPRQTASLAPIPASDAPPKGVLSP